MINALRSSSDESSSDMSDIEDDLDVKINNNKNKKPV